MEMEEQEKEEMAEKTVDTKGSKPIVKVLSIIR